MTYNLPRPAMLLPLMAPFLLAACAVPQDKYDAVVAQNQQLQLQLAAEQAHVSRLQGAIRYTVNSDLLFQSGGWQMSAQGKDIIGKMAHTLAPGQRDKLIVTGFTDNTPVGPELQQMGITSNDMLSQKRAETVMSYMISQGVPPDLVAAKGLGEAQPIAPNDTPQRRAVNRRVEVSLAGS